MSDVNPPNTSIIDPLAPHLDSLTQQLNYGLNDSIAKLLSNFFSTDGAKFSAKSLVGLLLVFSINDIRKILTDSINSIRNLLSQTLTLENIKQIFVIITQTIRSVINRILRFKIINRNSKTEENDKSHQIQQEQNIITNNNLEVKCQLRPEIISLIIKDLMEGRRQGHFQTCKELEYVLLKPGEAHSHRKLRNVMVKFDQYDLFFKSMIKLDNGNFTTGLSMIIDNNIVGIEQYFAEIYRMRLRLIGAYLLLFSYMDGGYRHTEPIYFNIKENKIEAIGLCSWFSSPHLIENITELYITYQILYLTHFCDKSGKRFTLHIGEKYNSMVVVNHVEIHNRSFYCKQDSNFFRELDLQLTDLPFLKKHIYENSSVKVPVNESLLDVCCAIAPELSFLKGHTQNLLIFKNSNEPLQSDIKYSEREDSTMEVQLSSEILNKDELYQTFCQDMEQLSESISEMKRTEVSIYDLRYSITVEESEQDNPKFQEWKMRRDAIMDRFSQDCDDGETEKKTESKGLDDEHRFYLKQLGAPPAIKCIQKTEKKELKETFVNKISKSIDTLYLSKHNHHNLVSLMSNYNRKDGLFQELELPKKLGILLWGPPGSGKSTTIRVIATYLGKDLYYVDLSNVQSNRDLKEIFDHIRNRANGGIVVFEDIDSMTSIVKPRELVNASATNYSCASDTDTYAEDKLSDLVGQTDASLTLSYLLNLLDGTLSASNTVYVMTTNHPENLDRALIRSGRIDINLKLDYADHYQIATIFQKIFKRELSEELLASIPEHKWTPADLISHFIQYTYLSHADEEIVAGLNSK